MSSLTSADLSVIAERADAATPGPWMVPTGIDEKAVYRAPDVFREEHVADTVWDADATFIAASRSDVPALLAEVLRLREGIQEAITLHSVESREAYVLADFLTGLISEVRADAPKPSTSGASD